MSLLLAKERKCMKFSRSEIQVMLCWTQNTRERHFILAAEAFADGAAIVKNCEEKAAPLPSLKTAAH
jgi:hypothetical protein